MKKITKLITHDGSFHTDDIFAAATLSIMLSAKGEDFEIIRTRDLDLLATGDYIFDVGAVYDEAKNKFDHHQVGGAGKRENGIEYAAFGLVWKKFGLEISGSQKVYEAIDARLVIPIDAFDNGIDLYKNNFENLFPYTLNDVMSTFSRTALEEDDKDGQFMKALSWAKEILSREIKKASDQVEITKIIRSFYEKAEDKRLIVVDKPKVSRFEIWEALQEFPEPLFVVYGDKEDWSVVAMRGDMSTFGNRKNFPEAWRGLRDKELQSASGVSDAVFCHRNLFMAVAKSKQGATKLGQIAVES